VRAASRGLQKT